MGAGWCAWVGGERGSAGDDSDRMSVMPGEKWEGGAGVGCVGVMGAGMLALSAGLAGMGWMKGWQCLCGWEENGIIHVNELME